MRWIAKEKPMPASHASTADAKNETRHPWAFIMNIVVDKTTICSKLIKMELSKNNV
jgi:hypothetical protein